MAAAERAHGLLALAVSSTAENAPGADRVDVRLDVPTASIPDFSELRSCLSAAVNLALAGLLLTRPALPEVRALRSWCLEQVSAAAAGSTNHPWFSVVSEDDDIALDPGVYDTTRLRTAEMAMVAADDRDRIVAVNAGAARLLRWTAQELVGHRLVAIIPSRLRDAHVAGFSRHQLTGETRILGSPIRVPVLRGDSSEIVLDLLLTEEPAPSGRALYFGRFTEPDESSGAAPTPS